MCGSLVASLNIATGSTISSTQFMYRHNLLLNLGRTTTYALLGMFAAIIVTIVGYAVSLPAWGSILRIFAGCAMIMAGLQVGFAQYLKKLTGTKNSCCELAKLRKPVGMRSLFDSDRGSYFAGLAWGMVPCGMVYNIILFASTSGSVPKAALIMTGFGIGTIPTMILSGVAAQRFRRIISGRQFRQTAGVSLMIMGLLYIFASSFAPGIPELQSLTNSAIDHFVMICH